MSFSKLALLCEKIIEAGWLAVVVIAPLFFNPYTSTVTQTDKLLLLRSIAVVMAMASLIQFIERRDGFRSLFAILRVPMALAILVFLFVEIISSLASISPRISLFGAYHRPDGLEALLTYLIIFAMIAQNLRRRSQLNRLMVAIILPSLPVALYAIVQRFGMDPLNWSGEDFGERVGSTLGNPIFMAGYLIIAFTLTLGKISQSFYSLFIDKNHATRVVDISALVLYSAIATTQALAIFYSESRGPWLGEFAGLFFLAFLFAILAHKYWLKRAILAVGISGILFLVLFNLPNSPLGALRDLPGLGRLGRLSDSTASFRTQTWNNVARLVAPHPALQFPDGNSDALNSFRPILGYGVDTLSLIYPQFALPDPLTQSRATDHSHNETWDTLADGGILGLFAYQFLFLTIFLQGLGYLDLVPTRRARHAFIGLWFGLALVGVGAALTLGAIQYVGLAIPAGNVAAIAIYLTWVAFQSKKQVAAQKDQRRDQILMAVLMAGLIAHFVETQFGINLVATRTLFWVMAGLVWVVASGALKETEAMAVERNVEPWRVGIGEAFSYAFIIALALSTMIFGFVISGPKDAWLVLWNALTFNPILQRTSYAVLAMVLATLTIGVAIGLVELRRAREFKQVNAGLQAVTITGVATISALLFAFVHSLMVSALGALPREAMNSRDALTLGNQLVWLTNGYLILLFAFIALYAIAGVWKSETATWLANPWTRWAIAPIVLAAFFLANSLNFDLARADVFYRLGKAMDARTDWNASIALYQRAATLSLSNDAYYMALASAFSEKANSPEVGSVARFNDQTSLKDVLDWNESSPLNRNDLLYATLLTLLRAHDLNPLYVDHTLNLARFYIPEAPIDSPSKERLAGLAEKYFAQAVRLDPNNGRVWNEWADFQMTYRNDADAALQVLSESVKRDPKFVETFIAIGEAHRAKQDWAGAAEAFSYALALDPTRADAASKLAFVYYRQGKHAEAIAAYQTFIELAPESANLWEAHKNLALLYDFENDAVRAIREARIAAQLAPQESRDQVNQLIAQLQAKAAAN